jgi:hypothetical protein
LLFNKYYKDNKITKVEMDGECSTLETVIIFVGRCDKKKYLTIEGRKKLQLKTTE